MTKSIENTWGGVVQPLVKSFDWKADLKQAQYLPTVMGFQTKTPNTALLHLFEIWIKTFNQCIDWIDKWMGCLHWELIQLQRFYSTGISIIVVTKSQTTTSCLIDKITPVSIWVVMTIDTFPTRGDGDWPFVCWQCPPTEKGVHFLSLHGKQVPFVQEDCMDKRAHIARTLIAGHRNLSPLSLLARFPW